MRRLLQLSTQLVYRGTSPISLNAAITARSWHHLGSDQARLALWRCQRIVGNQTFAG